MVKGEFFRAGLAYAMSKKFVIYFTQKNVSRFEFKKRNSLQIGDCFFFEDYSIDELVEIFKNICEESDYSVDEVMIEKVRLWLQNKLDEKNGNFANGRVVRNLFDDITMNQAKRLVRDAHEELDKNLLEKLLPEDVPELKG